MGWNEYYQSKCTSFGEQANGYRGAIDQIKKFNPDFLKPSTSKTIVLGGFFPTNGTPEEFLAFCRSIHPNAADRHLLIDMNAHPVKSAQNGHRIQGLLENTPFKRESIDLIFLDFTLYLMNDDQVVDFSYQANRFLKPGGAVLAAVPANPPLDLDRDLFEDRPKMKIVPYFFRNPSDIMHISYYPTDNRHKLAPQVLTRDGNNYVFGFVKQR